ncbi:hypothetical protein ACIQMR_33450 [Streptomyces sp. NPDC091376]|uniref:hypothetical protein n=1 Tax=Streptomyces sp. NPDC091376 TaxID=3365994 RepID=UPI0037F2F491
MSALTGGPYDQGLVVLTQNNPIPHAQPAHHGWFQGIDTIERLARAVHHDLYPDQPPSHGYQPPRPTLQETTP